MEYPIIDLKATGDRINRLRKERKISVKYIAAYLGFNNPNSIYRWFRGETLPTLENIYALSSLFDVSINDMIVRYDNVTERAS